MTYLGKGTTNLEGRVKTTTAPFFQRDRLYIVGFMSLWNEAERGVNSLIPLKLITAVFH
jgi:hypothetical protein